MSLEEKFNNHITDNDTACFVTVGDAIAFIRRKVG
jgi:acyl carrier protein